MRRRRVAIVVLVIIALALLVAPAALAAGGGGSAGFGGGSSGGGGGGGGGGKAFFIYVILRAIIDLIIFSHGATRFIVIGLIVAAVLFFWLGPKIARWRAAQESQGRAARRQTTKRQRRTELAAAEAADDDPMFAPDNVRAAAARLYNEVQVAWDQRDRRKLRSIIAPELLDEWERRLDDLDRRGWHNRVQVIGEPRVEYVGLQRAGKASDCVTVRVECKLRDYVEDVYGNHIKRSGHLTETVRTREFWTMTKRAGHWILQSIEQGAEGSHALNEELVATPWGDEQSLKDEALVEQAVGDAVPDGTKIAEVADLHFDGDAHAAANDLSLADGRFAPDVLEVAARRVVAAWARAIDGSDSELRKVATPQATNDLLHPGDPSRRTRLVVRGPQVSKIRITNLDAGAEPPTMSIEVEIKGRRYIENRDTTQVIAGNASRATAFTEHWTLALNGDDAEPWRIVAVGTPIATA